MQFLNRETNPCSSGGRGFRSLFVANDARYMKHDIRIYREEVRSSWKRNLIPQSDEGSPWLDTSFQLSRASLTSREVEKRGGFHAG